MEQVQSRVSGAGFLLFYRGNQTQNSHKYSQTVTKSRLLRQRNRYQITRKVVSRVPDAFGTSIGYECDSKTSLY